uniref:Intraflagellar transport protein 52 homolog n=1 Tax=Octactis speculum TaxID=3111310 RepID=A0A7S2D5V8_9STRA|mmetsp:Transcript_43132/g.58917  ORF Transcript_43132/g.58917 Transcript_43132/m.58917 type:complete len:534 (+) Transcript_43132:81-1682(+)
MEEKSTRSASSSTKSNAKSDGKKSIFFNACKREQYHANSGYKKLSRRLRSTYKVQSNKDDLSAEKLDEADLIIFGGPRESLGENEISELSAYIRAGGSALFLAGENMDEILLDNLNTAISEFGIVVNKDSVVRTVYYKYLYPKEVFIANGILQPSIASMKNVAVKAGKGSKSKSVEKAIDTSNYGGLNFVFPFGASLNVERPALAILSSGPISYPLNRPIAAVYEAEPASAPEPKTDSNTMMEPPPYTKRRARKTPGRVMVLGSLKMFSDEWIDKEENGKLSDVLVRWLLHESGVELHHVKDSDLSEYVRVPDTKVLATRIRSCLQENEELPKDFQKLFNDKLFKFDTHLIPEAIALYDKLGVKHEPMSLIPPQFETPLPPLAPAVFPPALRELPPPALDQFDLDEHFASPRQRLAQLTNKCNPDDLDYYVKECGDIIGVTQALGDSGKVVTAADILSFVFEELVKFKSVNQDDLAMVPPLSDVAGGGGGEPVQMESLTLGSDNDNETQVGDSKFENEEKNSYDSKFESKQGW